MSVSAFSRGIQFAKEKSRQYLAHSLGSFPGLPAKAGQLFLNRLASSAPVEVAYSLSVEEVKEILAREVPHLSEQLRVLDPEPKVASLGQVHRVTLLDGRDLAVKVQFPEVEGALTIQLDILLGVFRSFSRGSRFGMDARAYDSFLRGYFSEELDYQRELANQQAFWDSVAEGPQPSSTVVPRVFAEYSTRRVLVQSYEPSMGMRELVQQSQADRNRCAQLLVDSFLRLIFRDGLVHADLHEKNWGYRGTTGQLVLYDFGGVLKLDRLIVESLRRLVEAAAGGGDVYAELIELGFDSQKLQVIRKQLSAVCFSILEPLLAEGDWDPSRWDLREKLTQILGEHRWAFRSAGPPWFLVLMKTVFSLHQCLVLLRVKISVRSILEEWVSLRGAPLDQTPCEPLDRPVNGAQYLYVRVSEGASELVSLEFPVRAVESLEYLMSDEVRERVEAAGLDLVQIRKKAHAEGYPRGVLFEMTYQKRTYFVALG